MKRILSIIMGVIFLLPVCWADEAPSFKEQKDKDSYSLGYDFGSNLKRQGVELDLSILLSAVQDGLANKKPALDPEEIRQNLLDLRLRLMVLQDQRFREFSAKNKEEGKAFLKSNGLKEGVKELPSGLQYRVLVEGTGPLPKLTDSVTLHYSGALINGTEFDSSYARGEPETLPLVSLMQGWQEALLLMKAGSKWQIFVPPDLAYGQRQSDRIPPNSTLIFEIALLGVGNSSIPALDGVTPPVGNGMEEEVRSE